MTDCQTLSNIISYLLEVVSPFEEIHTFGYPKIYSSCATFTFSYWCPESKTSITHLSWKKSKTHVKIVTFKVENV